jgi:lysophospholipase L1-like esterase
MAEEIPGSGQEFGWYRLGEPEGRGWPMSETLRPTDRLPARARDLVPEAVWDLSRHSAGLYYRFRTDATELAARWTVSLEPIALGHMPAGSCSGVDLYAADDRGRLRWAALGVPTAVGTTTALLLSGIRPDASGLREYRLYLPLHNRVDDVAIGVPPGARFEIVDPDPTPPILYYGTSIVHGIAASRCGMAMPAQLGRILGRPVIGLGFSGNARMEIELAALYAELDVAAYLIDCLPNMTAEQVAERAEPFVRRLRQDRPTTPILLIEDRTMADAWIREGVQRAHDERRTALRNAHQRLVDSGDENLHYLPATGLLGTDDEGTVDGSHPSDLGFTRMVTHLVPACQKLVGQVGRFGQVG